VTRVLRPVLPLTLTLSPSEGEGSRCSRAA